MVTLFFNQAFMWSLFVFCFFFKMMNPIWHMLMLSKLEYSLKIYNPQIMTWSLLIEQRLLFAQHIFIQLLLLKELRHYFRYKVYSWKAVYNQVEPQFLTWRHKSKCWVGLRRRLLKEATSVKCVPADSPLPLPCSL